MKALGVGPAVLAALLVTGVALALDGWDRGARPIEFPSGQVALPAQGPEPATGAGTAFQWDAPRNATGGRFTVHFEWEGQSARGGSAILTVEVHGPDGKLANRTVAGLAVAAGATSGATDVEVDASWARAPDARTGDPDRLPRGHAWDLPIRVVVRAEPPGDLPVASYAFTATAWASVDAYGASVG